MTPFAIGCEGHHRVKQTKKPAPDIYRWVLEHLNLPASKGIAIEDSRNGVRSALGAGLPVVVTQSTYTAGEDFTGATAVVSDLGEPGASFSLLAGAAPAHPWVDASALQTWARC